MGPKTKRFLHHIRGKIILGEFDTKPHDKIGILPDMSFSSHPFLAIREPSDGFDALYLNSAFNSSMRSKRPAKSRSCKRHVAVNHERSWIVMSVDSSVPRI